MAERPRKKLLLNSTIYFMFLPLIQRPTPPKQWNCASPTPPVRPTSPPYYHPSRPPVFGWLLHVKSSIGGHLRPWFILYFIFFCRSICRPKQWDSVPLRAPCPARLRSNTPYRFRQLSGDCCLKPPNGGHLRPEPGASLYFFLRPIPTL